MTCSKLVHDFTTANDSNVKPAKACLSLAQLSPSLFTENVTSREEEEKHFIPFNANMPFTRGSATVNMLSISKMSEFGLSQLYSENF